MKENEFSARFMKAWQVWEKQMWYHKIADVPVSVMEASGEFRFVPHRAVDYLCCLRGRFIAIEFKLHHSAGSFPVSALRIQQVQVLQAVEIAGGVGLIAIGQVIEGGS